MIGPRESKTGSEVSTHNCERTKKTHPITTFLCTLRPDAGLPRAPSCDKYLVARQVLSKLRSARCLVSCVADSELAGKSRIEIALHVTRLADRNGSGSVGAMPLQQPCSPWKTCNPNVCVTNMTRQPDERVTRRKMFADRDLPCTIHLHARVSSLERAFPLLRRV